MINLVKRQVLSRLLTFLILCLIVGRGSIVGAALRTAPRQNRHQLLKRLNHFCHTNFMLVKKYK